MLQQWDYIGDVIVGVVCTCDCPPIEDDGFSAPIPPHEQHDLIPPVSEDQLPDGWTMEAWIAACRLVAAAPNLLACCKTMLADVGNYRARGGKLTDKEAEHVRQMQEAVKKAEAKP